MFSVISKKKKRPCPLPQKKKEGHVQIRANELEQCRSIYASINVEILKYWWIIYA